MAVYASKQFNGASYGARHEYVLIQQIEKDITNNRSKLRVTFCVYGSDPGSTLYQHYVTNIDVAGQDVFDYPHTYWYGSGSASNPVATFPAAAGTVTKDIWVNHDTYGNCTITVYFYTGIFNSSSQGNYGGSMTLENIPRASTPSCNNVTLDSAVTINTNRAADVFTHTINIKSGSTTIETFTSVGASKSWTPAVNKYAKYIPNSTTGTFTIECITYSGSTNVGTKTCTVVLTVPSSVKPSASVKIEEADTVIKNTGWGVYVKDKSTLKVTITGTKAYESNIASYSSTVQGTTYSGSSYTSNVLTVVGAQSVKANVTDNRGRTSSDATASYTVIDYFKPKINTANIERCDVNGNPNDEGEFLLYSFAGSIAPVSNKNAKTYKIGYRTKGSTAAFTYITIGTSYDLSKTNVILTNSGGTKLEFDSDTSFELVFQATDTFETVSTYKDIGTGFDLLNLNASGNSLAIGKISEAGATERLFEIGIDTKYKGQPLLEYDVTAPW